MKNKKKIIIATIATLLSAGLLATGGYFIYKALDNKQIEQQQPTPDVPDTPGDEIPLTYEVTINIEGETTIQTVAVGGLVTFPEEPTKEGHKFLGYVIEGSEELINQETFIVTSNVTLVAVFELQVTSLSNFTIDNGKITGYTGESNIVVFPDSYSLDSEGNVIEGTDILITTIGSKAFENSTISKVVFSENITTISSDAFKKCINLTEIYITTNISNIGASSFNYCSSLQKIVVDEKNKTYDSRNNCNAIISSAYNQLIAGCQNTVIPNTVTTISSSAFSGHSELKSIIIPNSVTSIFSHAFTSTGLERIEIPESVTILRNSTFAFCKSLKEIVLPSTLATLELSVFEGCAALETITIPSSVTTIGSYTFGKCYALNKIIIESTEPCSIQSTSFYQTNVIYVPDEALESYQTADVWSNYADNIKSVSELEA